MKTILLLLGLLLGFVQAGSSQENSMPQSSPLVITLQFHSLALPFRNMDTNFRNVGVGIGTELPIDGWIQSVSAMWYRNRTVGNGLMLFTQAVWRPGIGSDGFGEIKGGIGYAYVQRPVESYRQVNGEWTSAGKKGKGMLAIPVGTSIGYSTLFNGTLVSPFVSYQFVVLSGYNKSIPVLPHTILEFGSRTTSSTKY